MNQQEILEKLVKTVDQIVVKLDILEREVMSIKQDICKSTGVEILTMGEALEIIDQYINLTFNLEDISFYNSTTHGEQCIEHNISFGDQDLICVRNAMAVYNSRNGSYSKSYVDLAFYYIKRGKFYYSTSLMKKQKLIKAIKEVKIYIENKDFVPYLLNKNCIELLDHEINLGSFLV